MPGIVECDEELGEMGMFPLTDIDCIDEDDAYFVRNEQNNPQTQENAWKPVMTLKQRRHRKLSAVPDVELFNDHLPRLNSISHIKIDNNSTSPFETDTPSPRMNWLKAFRKIKTLSDPWAKYRIQDRKSEIVVRHRYNAVKKTWETDEVNVKVEEEVTVWISQIINIHID